MIQNKKNYIVLAILFILVSDSQSQIWPIENHESPAWLTSPFGSRNISKSGYHYDFHRGIDIRADVGASVRAIRSGHVIDKSTYDEGQYQFLVIKNIETGIVYQYTHIVPNLVIGDIIDQGDIIGTVFNYSDHHLDVKYYPEGDYRNHVTAQNPLRDLNYLEPTPWGHLIYGLDVLETSQGEHYVRVNCLSHSDAPDFEGVKLYLSGSDQDGIYYNELILLKADDMLKNEVNYHDRLHCGDVDGKDTDNGLFYNSENELCIEIIPQAYYPDEAHHVIEFRFYLDEFNFSQLTCLQAQVLLFDVCCQRETLEALIFENGNCSNWQPHYELNPNLITGSTSSGTLLQIGDEDYFSFLGEVDNIGLRAVVNCPNNNFDSYGRFKAMVSTTSYTWKSPDNSIGTDTYIYNVSTIGPWNILVNSVTGQGPYNITLYNIYNDPGNGVRVARNTGGPAGIHFWQMEVGESATSMDLLVEYPESVTIQGSCIISLNHGKEPTATEWEAKRLIPPPFQNGSYSWSKNYPDIGLWYLKFDHFASSDNPYHLTWSVSYNPTDKGFSTFGQQIQESILMGQYHIWKYVVDEYSNSMNFALTCGTNDYDLYFKLGSTPSLTNYDWKCTTEGGEEFQLLNPELGTWYVMIYAKNGNGTYQVSSSISSEFTSVQRNVTLSGTIDLEESLVISNDATLTINPGTTIKIGDFRSILVNNGSSIYANGTESQPIYFKRLNTYDRWNKISLYGDHNDIPWAERIFNWCIFDGGTYNVHIASGGNIFQNCIFKNADVAGIYSYYFPGNAYRSRFHLTNCLLENNDYGILANHSDEMWVIGCTITNNNYDGIKMVDVYAGDGAAFTDNIISNNGRYGLYVSYSDINLGAWSWEGRNRITNNASHEIYLDGDSRVYLGYTHSTYPYDSYGGYNTIYDENGFGVSGRYIYNLAVNHLTEDLTNWEVPAEYTRWFPQSSSDEIPQSAMYYGRVKTSNWLDYDPTLNSGSNLYKLNISKNLPKQVITSDIATLISTQSSDSMDYLSIKNDIISLKNRLRDQDENTIQPFLLRELNGIALLDRKNILGERESSWDLIKMWRDILISKRNNINANTHLAGEIAMLLEIENAWRNGSYSHAEYLIDKYEDYLTNEDNQAILTFYKLMIYDRDEDYSQALSIIEKLRRIRPEFILRKDYSAPDYSDIELGILLRSGKDYSEARSIAKKNRLVYENLVNQIPIEFKLYPNYPNPFNPSTKIPFDILEPSKVVISIYNLIGQKVIELVHDEIFNAGFHEIEFRGDNLPSGIYFVRAEFTPLSSGLYPFVSTIKSLLVK